MSSTPETSRGAHSCSSASLRWTSMRTPPLSLQFHHSSPFFPNNTYPQIPTSPSQSSDTQLGFSGSCTELGSIQLRDAVKETKQLSKLSKICAIIALLLISDFSPTLRHRKPVPSIELVSVLQTTVNTNLPWYLLLEIRKYPSILLVFP